jgi:YidC/Oxa1 family membrane protein insertase
MDRNSAIGLTLIAALLLAYFYWFSPTPQPQDQKPVSNQSAVSNEAQRDTINNVPDSTAAVATFGDLSGFARGSESTTTVETDNFKIQFSSKGGVIKDLELKKYKTYWQTPLKLVTPASTKFSLSTDYKGKNIDLYSLYYQADQREVGDTTVVSFTLKLTDGSSIIQSYSIPRKGYEIRYAIRQTGLEQAIGGDNLTFEWTDKIRPMEKDLQDTRDNSTINYYTVSDGFDYLSERSTSEAEILKTPVKWIAIKQKFFLSSIIAESNFSSADISTFVPQNDTAIVEQATAKLSVPKAQILKGTTFKYYFGPNDYQEIGDVTDKFKENVYLGWPPVYWINKFIIFPVFHFLTTMISNYGLIIIILVVLLKLVLFPLSYKSYLSMAKMKVLKPELDEIKEKNGDDMAKVQQDQLKLYQQVGVNPISGCIPVLLQMPILFAMFYLFPASIELRQQPFLWAEDLSTYDSIIQLGFEVPFMGSHISLFTLLMTVSTLIYTWQNNQLSSVQGPMKSMSYIMPVIFFFVLNRFSAGLTFYYFVSNLVTFAQQAIIRKFVDENKIKAVLEENRKKNLAGGGGKKSKFMSKLEDAMKASEEARKRAEEERKKKKK